MRRALPLLLLLVPVVELVLLVRLGGAIGVGPVLAIVLLGMLAGSAVVRRQGRAAWLRVREAAAAGRPPADEAADGALLLLGGALLVVPGLLTDVAGIALLIPPLRGLLRRTVLRGAIARAAAAPVRLGPMPAAPGARGASWRPAPGPADVDGTARPHPSEGAATGARPGGASPGDVEGTARPAAPGGRVLDA